MEAHGNGHHSDGHTQPPLVKLTRKDFVSDQEVRWCPGCGDYAILAQVQKVMPELGISRENIVFVSGIGCSSRFPYYMNTYGFHSIHGRAPAVATGIKSVNPNLSVWVVTGDGDALSIGGNHFIHALRRNLNIKIIMFNNRIYGLTKGQYSPTSEFGKKTKSTPHGSIDYPMNPISLALGTEATFVARSVDRDTKHLSEMIERAATHKGSAFVEVFQNCNIFNDGAFEAFVDRAVKEDRMINLEHGKPLLFGKDRHKGVRWTGQKMEVVELGNGVTESDLLIHDEQSPNPGLAFLLGRMEYPAYPVPVGVFRAIERPTYEDLLEQQVQSAIQQRGPGHLSKLLHDAETWTIE